MPGDRDCADLRFEIWEVVLTNALYANFYFLLPKELYLTQEKCFLIFFFDEFLDLLFYALRRCFEVKLGLGSMLASSASSRCPWFCDLVTFSSLYSEKKRGRQIEILAPKYTHMPYLDLPRGSSKSLIS